VKILEKIYHEVSRIGTKGFFVGIVKMGKATEGTEVWLKGLGHFPKG